MEQQQKQLSTSRFMLHSTIRIESKKPNDVISTGTGFYYNYQITKKDGSISDVPTIVSNKHVIKDALVGNLRFDLELPENGKIARNQVIQYGDFEKRWLKHPEPNVDLCILPLAPLYEHIQKITGTVPIYTVLGKSDIISTEDLDGLTYIEDVSVVGYPDGLWDSKNNLPIVRKGITATPIQFDYLGKREFLIDAAIFPGSSGSPVFLFDEGTFKVKSGLVFGDRLKLLGIIYATYQHTSKGELRVEEIPSEKVEKPYTSIPNNLGVVIKAERLLDFESILKTLV